MSTYRGDAASSPRLLSLEEEQNGLEMSTLLPRTTTRTSTSVETRAAAAAAAASAFTSTSPTTSRPTNRKRWNGKQCHNTMASIGWMITQLLAPVASLVAILHLLHYLRHHSDQSNSSSSSSSINDLHTANHNFLITIRGVNNTDDTTSSNNNNGGRIYIDMSKENSDPALQGLRQADCQYFWAPSAIIEDDDDDDDNNAVGWGVFTALDMKRGVITQSMPDLCLEYSPDDDKKTPTTAAKSAITLESYIWSQNVLFPSSPTSTESKSRRVICQGMASLLNSMPDDERRTATSKVIPLTTPDGKQPSQYSHLDRSIVRDDDDDDFNAGGGGGGGGAWLFQANHKIPAGSELTIEYYKQDESILTATNQKTSPTQQKKFYDPDLNITVEDAPMHPPEWLRLYGKCLDHVEIRAAGRKESSSSSSSRPRVGGAFATRNLAKGTLVMPAPVLVLAKPKNYDNNNNDATSTASSLPLWINYCFQLRGDSNVLFFPYAPSIGAIHHSSRNSSDYNKQPNVALRWSEDDNNDPSLLLTSATPGMVVYSMEIYAVRDIREGDELCMDFGAEWESVFMEYEKTLAATATTTSSSSRPVFRHAMMLPESLFSTGPPEGTVPTTTSSSTTDPTGTPAMIGSNMIS